LLRRDGATLVRTSRASVLEHSDSFFETKPFDGGDRHSVVAQLSGLDPATHLHGRAPINALFRRAPEVTQPEPQGHRDESLEGFGLRTRERCLVTHQTWLASAA